MKRVLLPVALLFAALTINAQEDAVKEAKRKMATDPIQAEALIQGALTNPETMSKADTSSIHCISSMSLSSPNVTLPINRGGLFRRIMV